MKGLKSPGYVLRMLDTRTGPVPVVATRLTLRDRLGAMFVRFSINRMNYKVEPGLYAVGAPTPDSHVFVTANYKLSFDSLRMDLTGWDAWILVLDTKGINVWCAAGEGTFGTDELVERIRKTGLSKLLKHKHVIIPQLGAVGVSGYEVTKRTGFNVIFGPVRASDIPAFINSGMRATPEMRRVRFGLWDRFKLVGVEVVGGLTFLLLGAVLLSIPFILKSHGIHSGRAVILNLIFAYLAGSLLGPVLLPWLPGHAFAFKGVFTGLIAFVSSLALGLVGKNPLQMIGWALLMTSISSYILMNFTGASTYTSISGVRKEMRIALPLQFIAVLTGTALVIIKNFI